MLLTTALLLIPHALPQDGDVHQDSAKLLSGVVLKVNQKEFTAQNIIESNPYGNDALLIALQRDPIQASLFINSPAFFAKTRSFADSLHLDGAKLEAASEEEALEEAKRWAADRSRETPAVAILANHGILISNRARLLANQQDRYGTSALRQHMLSSIPEFFGEIAVSTIRIPLVDFSNGKIVSSKERKSTYDLLDNLAQDLRGEKISWEDAVVAHSIKADHEKHGYLGLLSRKMTNRYEESFLRQIFTGLGFKTPEQHILRGPILTDSWAYLVRIESVRTRGVVDLQQVRDTVERSLREKMLQETLTQLRAATPTQYFLPLNISK